MPLRRKSWPSAEDSGEDVDVTPGSITTPQGVMPGWDWTPPAGLEIRSADVPWWVHVWRGVPLLDRYAYVWMWNHGGFRLPPAPEDGGDPSGDREPREPLAPAPSLVISRSPGSGRRLPPR